MVETFATYKKHYEFEYKGDMLNAIDRVGGNGPIELENQFELMMKSGLQRFHKFLDLGCGCLRGTARLVDYLNQGNFYGADVSKGLIDAGWDRLKRLNIEHTPSLVQIDDFKFGKFQAQLKFDYILSISLLTHLLPDDVSSLFDGIKSILAENGVYIFSIIPSELWDHVGDVEMSRYNRHFLGKLAQSKGLVIRDILGDYPNPATDWRVMERVNTPYIGQWVMEMRHAS